MRYFQSRRRGFTLVELLVVIGIIALLISILLPALNKARSDAYRVRCLNQQRQLVLAWMMYNTSSKGHLQLQAIPRRIRRPTEKAFGTGRWAATRSTAWRSACCGLISRTMMLYKCPNDRIMYTHTYSMNGYLAGEPSYRIFNQGQIKRNFATFCFIEEYDPRGYEINSFMVNQYPSNNWGDVCLNMHGGAGTVSFCDGHAIVWQWSDPAHAHAGPGE